MPVENPWGYLLNAEFVESQPVQSKKTIDDIPAPIIDLALSAYKAEKIVKVSHPSEDSAKVFLRELRSYANLVEPKLTIRTVSKLNGQPLLAHETAFRVKPFEARGEPEAASSAVPTGDTVPQTGNAV